MGTAALVKEGVTRVVEGVTGAGWGMRVEAR